METLKANVGGFRNVAIGKSAMVTNISGNDNVAVGNNALNVCTGSNNTAVGKDSGDSVAAGTYNLTLGIDSGQNITSGSGNIIIGTADAAAADSARTFKVVSYDGSSTTNHIISDSSGNMTLAADLTIGDDLLLDSDSCVLKFGDDQDVTLTHTD